MLLQRGKRIKAAGIHISEMVCVDKIGKIFPKTFSAVGKACCRGKSRTGAYHHRVCRLQRLAEHLDFILILIFICRSEEAVHKFSYPHP